MARPNTHRVQLDYDRLLTLFSVAPPLCSPLAANPFFTHHQLRKPMKTLRSQKLLLSTALAGLFCIAQGDDAINTKNSEEREGAATFIHRADVIRDDTTKGSGPMRLWPLHSTAESRMNYVEVTGRTGLHFHPDADHKLYVLEGKVLVTAGTNTSIATTGDLIIIPKGVRHRYDVPAKGDRALLLTFDAPPYDPSKTVNVEPAAAK
jgi:quercetin dioxygenase-like cupin family protein